MPLFDVENPQLHHLIIHQCDIFRFPSSKQLVQQHIPNTLAKMMKMHVLLTIAHYIVTTTTFDLWMSKIGFNRFVLMITFINRDWVPYYLIVRLFESLDTSRITLVGQVKSLLVGYQFINKIIVYFKDKGTNLNTLAFAFTDVVSCAPLQFDAPFSCTCFGHVMSKACQYAIRMILG